MPSVPRSEEERRGYKCRASLLLDSGVADQLFPQHELLFQERVELLGRARECLHAALGELVLDIRPLDDFADFRIQSGDDVLRHIGRAEITLPRRDVETL